MNIPGEHGFGTLVPGGQYEPTGHTLPMRKITDYEASKKETLMIK